AITHVTVIDATGSHPQPNMTVIIAGGRIGGIVKSSNAVKAPGTTVIDATGKNLIPGLWGMHVHISESGEASLPLFIVNGVTSVRDMGGDIDEIARWKEQVARGDLLGPRIQSAGPVLESARFVALVEKLTGESQTSRRVGVASPEEVREAVEDIAKHG